MPEQSFLVMQHYEVPLNTSHTFKYVVARNEQLVIHEIFMASDGTYDIVDISDDSGRNYSNCNASSPIPSIFLQDPAALLDVFKRFEPPIRLAGGDGFNIGVTDTSGANNDIWILLSCTRIIP